MKRIALVVLYIGILASCHRVIKPYSKIETSLLCIQLLNSQYLQETLALNPLNTDSIDNNIRIIDLTKKLSKSLFSIKLNNGVFLTSMIYYEIPLTLNSGYNYRDLVIVEIVEKKNKVTVWFVTTNYIQKGSNQNKRLSYYINIKLIRSSKTEFKLIDESIKSFDDSRLSSYYMKKYFNNY